MKESILISIKPKYVEQILSGKKTKEIRKTMPKCKLPIDVYIYVTKKEPYLRVYPFNVNENIYQLSDDSFNCLNGKVVAKFTLNNIEIFDGIDILMLQDLRHMFYKSCLTTKEIKEYSNGKDLYGWQIDNLKIFDEPMELIDFRNSVCKQIHNCKEVKGILDNHYELHLDYSSNFICTKCRHYDGDFNLCRQEIKTIKKAPQSWCYVEVRRTHE